VDALTVQFDDLRANRAWTVDGGQMRMRRDGDQLQIRSDLALLGGRDYVSSLSFRYDSTIGDIAAGFGVTVEDVVSEDIASQSPALAWLDIVRAPISGSMRVAIDASGELGPLSATLQISEGVIQPQGAPSGVPFQSARTYLTYTPETSTIAFSEIFVESPWVTARAEGKAHLEDFQSGLPNALIAQMRLTELRGNPADLFGGEIAIERAQADMRLQLDPFELRIGEMLIQDQGHDLILDARLGSVGDDWSVAVSAHMDALDARRVVEWWPENAAAKTRGWVDENVLQGQLYDINFAARSKPGAKPDFYLDFRFEDASVRYVKTLPIVTEAKGKAVLLRDRFTVLAHEGTVAPGQGGIIDVAGTSFTIANLRQKPAPAEVKLKTNATVTATLALLDHAPLSFLSKADLPVDLAEGKAQVSGLLELPLKKKLRAPEVRFDLTADMQDVRTGHFVKGKIIAAPRLLARADNESLTIEGAGRIGAVPFDAKFATALTPGNDGRRAVSGTLELSERFIDEFNIGLTRDLISSLGRGDFELSFKKGEVPGFKLTSDTRGLRMAIAPIGWSKPANRNVDLTVEGRLSTPLSVTNLVLDAPGLFARGNLSLKSTGNLDRVALSELRIGTWLNGSADLIGRPGKPPNIQLRSGSLDLRDAPANRRTDENSGGTGASTNIDVALDRVTISDGITLTNLTGDFATGGGFNGAFNARVNGGAEISGTVVPINGGSAVRIRSADAGGALRASGVLKQAIGGDLEVTLVPTGKEGQFNGQLRANSVRVKDAPAMAELLNAISVIGLLEQLGGEGIAFADVNAEFELNPGYVHLKQGSAAGPSMGISMDGIYDLNAGQLDMQGVVSPIYMLNAIGRPVSRRGEGLFGFNYSLRGPTDGPSVSVNPLSVLTPGFLRDIFRRPTRMPQQEAPSESQ